MPLYSLKSLNIFIVSVQYALCIKQKLYRIIVEMCVRRRIKLILKIRMQFSLSLEAIVQNSVCSLSLFLPLYKCMWVFFFFGSCELFFVVVLSFVPLSLKHLLMLYGCIQCTTNVHRFVACIQINVLYNRHRCPCIHTFQLIPFNRHKGVR